jgi:DNA-binding transcriptional ArsR family regulator
MDQLDLTFAALADPTRRAILARLAQGDASVAELAEPFEISARAVSLHVRVLQKAGLVTRSKDGQRRPSRLELAPLLDVDQWLSTYRRLWEARLDRMEEALDLIQKRPS